VVLSALTILGACSAFSSQDPATDDAGSRSDAGVSLVDAAFEDVVAIDAPVEASPTNLLSNGDFSAGCSPWEGGYATPMFTDDVGYVRSAPGACVVCGDPGVFDWSIYQVRSVDASVGRTFQAEAYVRSAPDAAAPPELWGRIDLRAPNGDVLQYGLNEPAEAQGPWHRVTASITVNEPDAGGVLFVVSAGTALNGCLVIDDALLY
jgi:hypothetical protein